MNGLYVIVTEYEFAGDNIVVDLFVMPAIQHQRPIALTIGRYHDYKPAMPKCKLDFTDPRNAAGRLEDISAQFDQLGVPADVAAYLADEVEEFIVAQSDALTAL